MHMQVYFIINCINLAYKAVIIDVDNKGKQQVENRCQKITEYQIHSIRLNFADQSKLQLSAETTC